MKSIAFLLLLDYSGSMDQVIDHKPKVEVLRSEMTALLSTADAQAQSGIIAFGTNSQKGCADISEYFMDNQALVGKLKSLKPGKFGKTPLTLGLRRTMQLAVERNVNSIVAVTDGADSCNQDPCKALVEIDKGLKPRSQKFRLQIIGFDLKDESNRLACLKDLKLKNIDVKLSESASSSELQNQLKQGQTAGLVESPAKLDAKSADIKGLRRTNVKVAGGDGADGADGKDANGVDKSFDPKTDALVEILGAPSTANFTAAMEDTKKEWLGSYVMKLKAGKYNVTYVDKNGLTLELDLPAGTRTSLPWARLMRVTESTLAVDNPIVNLSWKPSNLTKEIHGEVEAFTTESDYSRTQVTNSHLAFGEWEVEVTSPPWLVGILKNFKVSVKAGDRSQINLGQQFESFITWIDNPHPDKVQVLSLQKKNQRENRYLVSPGLKRIPIPKETDYVWLQGE